MLVSNFISCTVPLPGVELPLIALPDRLSKSNPMGWHFYEFIDFPEIDITLNDEHATCSCGCHIKFISQHIIDWLVGGKIDS